MTEAGFYSGVRYFAVTHERTEARRYGREIEWKKIGDRCGRGASDMLEFRFVFCLLDFEFRFPFVLLGG